LRPPKQAQQTSRCLCSSADLRAVLVKPEIRDKLAARGSFVRHMTPQELLNYINDQQTLWKPALERVAVQTQK
jgi:tripartite-type tricarboxylate transporter receptor subunit TctC